MSYNCLKDPNLKHLSPLTLTSKYILCTLIHQGQYNVILSLDTLSTELFLIPSRRTRFVYILLVTSRGKSSIGLNSRHDMLNDTAVKF